MYDAFISYSHAKDKPIAASLQSAIQKLGKPWYRRRAARVFRDDTSLAATPHLWPTIEKALGLSRHFILLASPEAAGSVWVNKEVSYWLEHNSIDTLLIGLTAGELAWDNRCNGFVADGELPLPPALRKHFENEPKWVDLRPYRDGADKRDAKFTELAADFAASIRGVPKEDLLSEEVRQQRRALSLAITAACSLFILTALAAWQWREATVQRHAAEQQLDQALIERARLLTSTAEDTRRAGHVEQTILLLREVERTIARSPRIKMPEQAHVTLARTFNLPNAGAIVWHGAAIRSVTFSADGRRLLTASDDRTAALWDADTGRPIATLQGHTGPVSTAVFGPDGQTILTASLDGTTRLWAADSGQPIKTFTCETGGLNGASFNLRGDRIVAASRSGAVCLWTVDGSQELVMHHQAPVHVAKFSPDGAMVLTASNDKTARLWDAQTGQALKILAGHTDSVVDAAFSPDGQTVVTASHDGTARLWNVQSGQSIAVLKHDGQVNSASFSGDGRYVVTTSYDRTAKLWNAADGSPVHAFKAHEDNVRTATISPDGRRLLTASSDNTARLWDIASGTLLKTLAEDRGYVLSAVFSPDGEKLATASLDRSARVWRSDDGIAVQTFRGHQETVNSASFSADERSVVTASYDKSARIWDARSGALQKIFAGHTGSVTSAAFSPDGRTIVTGSHDSTARVWDVLGGALLFTYTAHGGTVNSVAFSPDGRHVLTASDDRTAKLWDATSGRTLLDLPGHPSDVNCAVFSPDGKLIATASSDVIDIWDATAGTLLRQLKGHAPDVNSVAFSADGQYLASAADDRTARLWRVSSGALIRTFTGHEGRVYSVAFSADGRNLLTASEDHTIRVWDVASAKLIETIESHGDVANDAVFSHDGRRVLSASNDKTARIWALTSGPALAGEDIWLWLRFVLLRPFTSDERVQFSLTDSFPQNPASPAPEDVKWLAPDGAVDLAALKRAAANGSWGANLRLGEISESQPNGDILETLRAYGMAAELLDRAINRDERSVQPLQIYAEKAFGRRGSISRFLTAHGRANDVVRIAREVSLWLRSH